MNRPIPARPIEKNRSKIQKSAGSINTLINTNTGETTNETPINQPAIITPTKATNGPSTMTRLKNPNPMTAHTARNILLLWYFPQLFQHDALLPALSQLFGGTKRS